MEDFLYFKISGLSMWPLCRPGDSLLIDKVTLQNLRLGDIIVYRSRGQLICHRLLRKIWHSGKYKLRVRGDCSISRGEIVTEEQFLGRASAIVRDGGIISLLGFRKRINLALAVISPLFILGLKVAQALKIPINTRNR
jgi:signal peptidase I